MDTGDNIVRNNQAEPPTIIKIDIEGAELDAVRGMGEILQNHIRLFYIEVHSKLTDSKQTELKELLRSHGFAVETIYREPQSYYLKGTS